jgi:phenylalanyl-tRNA synthetase beta chain
VNRLLGTDIETERAAELLQNLGLKVQPMGNPASRGSQAVNMMVEVPSFRRDLATEVDLIEEIARLHGYDAITGEGRFRGSAGVRRRPEEVRLARLRGYLVAAGYTEMVTSSFMAAGAVDRLQLAEDDPRRSCLEIRNPHHGGDILLRTSLLPSLLDVARRNLNADCPVPARFFQANRVFWPQGRHVAEPRHPGEDRLPEEPLQLQMAVAGWRAVGTDGVPADLLELKGVLTEMVPILGQALELVPGDVEPFLAPGEQWRLEDDAGRAVGTAGRLHPDVAAAHDLDHPLAVAEIDLTRIAAAAEARLFRPFSRFPAVKRDLSLLVPEGVAYGDVATAVRGAGGPHLASVELFDVYRGKELGEARAAVGIRLKFRSQEGNLKGKTVDRAIADITAALDREHGIHLRS